MNYSRQCISKACNRFSLVKNEVHHVSVVMLCPEDELQLQIVRKRQNLSGTRAVSDKQ